MGTSTERVAAALAARLEAAYGGRHPAFWLGVARACVAELNRHGWLKPDAGRQPLTLAGLPALAAGAAVHPCSAGRSVTFDNHPDPAVRARWAWPCTSAAVVIALWRKPTAGQAPLCRAHAEAAYRDWSVGRPEIVPR